MLFLNFKTNNVFLYLYLRGFKIYIWNQKHSFTLIFNKKYLIRLKSTIVKKAPQYKFYVVMSFFTSGDYFLKLPKKFNKDKFKSYFVSYLSFLSFGTIEVLRLKVITKEVLS